MPQPPTPSTIQAMRALVTGASGLVGSAVAAALGARGHFVRALVRTGAGPACGDETVVGDIVDAGLWRRVLAGVEVVVHAAGAMSQDPVVLAHSNVLGTEVAVAAARAVGARVVFVSSAAVYAPGPMEDAGEDTALGPADAYGQSKLAGERTARRALGENLTILRPVSVYASDRPSPFLAAVRAVIAAGRVPVAPPGRTPIDFVHATDLAAAIVAATEGRGRGGVFNVPGPSAAPFLELVRFAASTLGAPLDLVALDDRSRAGFSPWLLEVAAVPRTVSGRLARDVLGYAPSSDWRRDLGAALVGNAAHEGT